MYHHDIMMMVHVSNNGTNGKFTNNCKWLDAKCKMHESCLAVLKAALDMSSKYAYDENRQ